MYQKGDLVIITEKETPKNYMFGMIINVYNEGVYVISLDKGTFDDSKFKKYKKLGIKYGKYLNFNKYNIYVSGKAEQYYSVDYTDRTIDRKLKHITYKIKTDYNEYVATFTDKENNTKIVAYVSINERRFNNQQILNSGGLVIAPYNSYIDKEDVVINRARARAKVNLYKQLSAENN